MDYVLKYRSFPTGHQREQLDWVRDTVWQLYNHGLHRFNRIPDSEGTFSVVLAHPGEKESDAGDATLTVTGADVRDGASLTASR